VKEFNIINSKLMDFNPRASNKEEAVRFMAEMLEADGRITDLEAYIANVFEREAISSTDTGVGIAIPHGKGRFVKESSVALCRFEDGLVWDQDPVKAVFLLAVDDDEEGKAHMELIAKISTMLMDDDFMELLNTAESELLLLDDINKRLEYEL